jgi:hypothetical protein
MGLEQVEAFLVELTELTKKYRIRIHGCGCCGSPYLEDHVPEGRYVVSNGDDNLTWKPDS